MSTTGPFLTTTAVVSVISPGWLQVPPNWSPIPAAVLAYFLPGRQRQLRECEFDQVTSLHPPKPLKSPRVEAEAPVEVCKDYGSWTTCLAAGVSVSPCSPSLHSSNTPRTPQNLWICYSLCLQCSFLGHLQKSSSYHLSLCSRIVLLMRPFLTTSCRIVHVFLHQCHGHCVKLSDPALLFVALIMT